MTVNARQLRKNSTPEEIMLWEKIRNRQLNGLKFRRQHPIGSYIVDFYCAQYHLVIELDGAIHKYHQEQDKYREEWLEAHGYTMIRFTNDQVINAIDQVLDVIQNACSK